MIAGITHCCVIGACSQVCTVAPVTVLPCLARLYAFASGSFKSTACRARPPGSPLAEQLAARQARMAALTAQLQGHLGPASPTSPGAAAFSMLCPICSHTVCQACCSLLSMKHTSVYNRAVCLSAAPALTSSCAVQMQLKAHRPSVSEQAAATHHLQQPMLAEPLLRLSLSPAQQAAAGQAVSLRCRPTRGSCCSLCRALRCSRPGQGSGSDSLWGPSCRETGCHATLPAVHTRPHSTAGCGRVWRATLLSLVSGLSTGQHILRSEHVAPAGFGVVLRRPCGIPQLHRQRGRRRDLLHGALHVRVLLPHQAQGVPSAGEQRINVICVNRAPALLAP